MLSVTASDYMKGILVDCFSNHMERIMGFVSLSLTDTIPLACPLLNVQTSPNVMSNLHILFLKYILKWKLHTSIEKSI